MSKVNNPYLEFAQSPDEIAISKTLFDLNPSLGADTLARYHFETLLLCERAKKEMEDLLQQAKDRRRKEGTGSAKESLGGRTFTTGLFREKELTNYRASSPELMISEKVINQTAQ